MALFAELGKIAAVTASQKLSFKDRAKRAGKMALYTAGAYGLGHATGMLVDKGVSRVMKTPWSQWDYQTRHKMLYPALGVATVGLMAATAHAQRKRAELEGRHE